MKKSLHLFLACLFLPFILMAQHIEIAVASGFAGCNMSELKDLNQHLMEDLPFESKVVSDFPAWFIYRASVVASTKEKYKIGVVYTHSSAGSRVSSADYSGEYRFDIAMTGNSVGLLLGYEVFKYKQLDIRFNAIIGGILSTCSLNEYIQLYESDASNNYSMKSLSFYLNPEIAINYRIGRFDAGIFGGFQYDTKGHLILSGQKTSTSTNWTGFRAGIALSVMLPYRKVGKPAKK